MLRDKNLIPLSHQHQRALALCVRMSRAIDAGEVDLKPWRAEIAQFYQSEITMHFAAEEKEVFPRAAQVAELAPLVRELQAEHELLRGLFSRAAAEGVDQAALAELAERLAGHIRKEERQLFEAMQKHLPPEELARIGDALEQALAEAPQTCTVPNPATQLRPKNPTGVG
jgi:hemerythrin-like domain-containing protein